MGAAERHNIALLPSLYNLVLARGQEIVLGI